MALAEDRAERDAWGDPSARAAGDHDALVVEVVRRHADQAMRVARRFSDTPEDALDAYQHALLQLVRHRARLRPQTVQAWLLEVVRREAVALRRQRRRVLPMDGAALEAITPGAAESAEERVLDLDAAARATEALGALKPDEARALTLQAAGLSYADIAQRLDWSATKTNRALTEGRRRFRHTFAELESGKACRRWAPLIAERREATPADRARLRVHLRHCPGCRATARQLRDTSSVLALVLPVPVAVTPGRGPRLLPRVADAVGRLGDAVAANVAERATDAVVKLQALGEAASAAKVAAVAASAVAVTGGGVVAGEMASRAEGAADPPRSPAAVRAAAAAPGRSTPTTLPLPSGAAGVRSRTTGTGARPGGGASGGSAREFRPPAAGTRRQEFAPRRGRPAARSFETAAQRRVSIGGEFGGRQTSSPTVVSPAPASTWESRVGEEFGG